MVHWDFLVKFCASAFATRHRIATTKEAVKDKASYSYKQLATALGREFR